MTYLDGEIIEKGLWRITVAGAEGLKGRSLGFPANLEIGYLTPPAGLNLIVAMAAFRENFGFICRAVIPFVLIMLAWLMVVSFWPPLVLYLVGK